MNNSPFKHNYFLGYVCEVYPEYVMVHFPSSVLLNKFIFSGEEFNAGLVGDYITIEGENHGFLGRVVEVSLSERERTNLTEKAFSKLDFKPKAKIELLLSFNYFNPLEIEKGIDIFPNIGAKVFVCSTEFLKEYLVRFGCKTNEKEKPALILLAKLTANKSTEIEISQQALFGRHCAVVGTTGGGKSWTVAKLLEGISKNGSKAIVLDATGEYSKFSYVCHCSLPVDSYFHYSRLTVDDIFLLLRPAGQVQSPKLMDAIRSLKIAKLLTKQPVAGIKIENGCLIKNSQKKHPVEDFYAKNIIEIETNALEIDINHLANQIVNECVWETGRSDLSSWGLLQENHLSNCSSLIARINNLINASYFRDIFGFDKNGDDDLIRKIESFLSGTSKILRIGFEKIGYDFQGREILANAIGKNLLLKARKGDFKSRPLIIFVDEAHQYLNKSVQDEYFMARPLDAFDQIAKECRKYGLFLCLATQMPRDIPIGTLSQMGTFIVHRLINFHDKEAISNACSSANKNILSFLPVLGEGEAVLTGVDFPMPLSIKISPPDEKPDSSTPLFNKV